MKTINTNPNLQKNFTGADKQGSLRHFTAYILVARLQGFKYVFHLEIKLLLF